MFEYLRFQNRTAKAFTLAEVLITLTIIGVIAALTIPALIQNIQDAQLKAAFTKEYSVVSSAYTSLVQDNGGSLKGVYNNASEFANAFKDKFSYVKYCPVGSAANCLPQVGQYTYLDGTTGAHPSGCYSGIVSQPGNISNWAAIVLPDGSNIIVTYWHKNCDYSDSYINNACTATSESFAIDVNGAKGPNILGKDLFVIMPYDTLVKPAGIPANMAPYTLSYNTCSTTSCSTSSSGFGCAANVLKGK